MGRRVASRMNTSRQTAIGRPLCVLLAGGALGSVLGVLRSLGPRGVPLYVAAPKQFLPCYASSRYCRDVLAVDPNADADVLLDRLYRWPAARPRGVRPLLLPMNDRMAGRVNERRAAWECGFQVALPRAELVDALMDKTRADRMAAEAGLDTPASAFVTCPEELRRALQTLSYPVVIKPTSWRDLGRASFKADVCDGADALRERAGRYLALGSSMTVQEYIAGGDEAVEVYMFYRTLDGHTLYSCTGRKMRQNPPGAGIMASGRAEPLDHVVALAARFLEAVDYRGLGGIEFKRCHSRSYFIEINVRIEACHPLAIAAGLDMPWLAYADHVMGPDAGPTRPPPQRAAYWLDERAYLELLANSRLRWPLVREAARLLVSGRTRCAVCSFSDPGPMIAHAAASLLKRLRRLAGGVGRV